MEITDIEGYFNEWKKRLRFVSQSIIIIGTIALFTFIGSYFHTIYPTSTMYTVISIILFIIASIFFILGVIVYILVLIKTIKIIKTITKEGLKQELVEKMEKDWNKIIKFAFMFSILGFFFMTASINTSILAYHYEFGLFSTILIWLYFMGLIFTLSSWNKNLIKK